MTIDLTPSELMALRDIVTHYLTIPFHSEVFVDVRNHVETTPEELLLRLMAATDEARGVAVQFHDPDDDEDDRVVRPLPSPSLVTEARAAVAAGAGHDCDEWTDITTGRCALCGRPGRSAQ